MNVCSAGITGWRDLGGDGGCVNGWGLGIGEAMKGGGSGNRGAVHTSTMVVAPYCQLWLPEPVADRR